MHVRVVKTTIGSKSVRSGDAPSKGKNGTGIQNTSLIQYKNAAPISEEETDEKSLYAV
jgi:hypothetical protein